MCVLGWGTKSDSLSGYKWNNKRDFEIRDGTLGRRRQSVNEAMKPGKEAVAAGYVKNTSKRHRHAFKFGLCETKLTYLLN